MHLLTKLFTYGKNNEGGFYIKLNNYYAYSSDYSTTFTSTSDRSTFLAEDENVGGYAFKFTHYNFYISISGLDDVTYDVTYD